MVENISTHYIFIYFLLHLLYYYANPRFKSTRETGVYHDRPGPCIARLLDPDRHVESPTRSYPLSLSHPDCTSTGSSRSVMHSILYSLFKKGKTLEKTRLAYWCQTRSRPKVYLSYRLLYIRATERTVSIMSLKSTRLLGIQYMYLFYSSTGEPLNFIKWKNRVSN